jgi:hypothetical protein
MMRTMYARALLSTLLLLIGCGAPRPAEEPKPSLIRGNRDKSRSVKASENRPHPWEEEKGVFQADRLDVEPYAEDLRRRHGEGHSKQILVLERFSHPACSGLAAAARTSCPLLAVRWTRRREVPGGVVLEGPASAKVSGPELQRRVLCHVAFARVQGRDDGCPLQLGRVRARVVEREAGLELSIVTDDGSKVGELRRRVKALIR